MTNASTDRQPRRAARPGPRKDESRQSRYSGAEVNRLKGPAVVFVWLGLALLAWGLVGGAMYGVCRLARMMAV